ncbi:MAG: septum formation initiator family protein, partial [Actinomycetota bacterium]|nr:septum formation initiator family protein [Actinomycetota bacterium]
GSAAGRTADQIAGGTAGRRDWAPRLTGRSIVVCVVLAVLLVSYATSLRAWLGQREQIAGLETGITTTQEELAALREERRRWQDPAYVEAEARRRLGWVVPGEIGLRVIDDDGQAWDETSSLTDPASLAGAAEPDWWDRAYASVQAAGQEPTVRRDVAPPADRLGPVRTDPPRMGPATTSRLRGDGSAGAR